MQGEPAAGAGHLNGASSGQLTVPFRDSNGNNKFTFQNHDLGSVCVMQSSIYTLDTTTLLARKPEKVSVSSEVKNDNGFFPYTG